VTSSRGGAKGGGAALTDTGETVLMHYRKLQEITAEAGSARISALCALLADMSDGK
jgi:molybdate transport system regulatory protein